MHEHHRWRKASGSRILSFAAALLALAPTPLILGSGTSARFVGLSFMARRDSCRRRGPAHRRRAGLWHRAALDWRWNFPCPRIGGHFQRRLDLHLVTSADAAGDQRRPESNPTILFQFEVHPAGDRVICRQPVADFPLTF